REWIDLDVGAVAGRTYAAIENCTVTGNIRFDFAENGVAEDNDAGTGHTNILVGGIAGCVGYRSVSGCTVRGDITLSLKGGEDVNRHGRYTLAAGGIAASSDRGSTARFVNNTNYADVVVEAGNVPGVNTRYDLAAAGIFANTGFTSYRLYTENTYSGCVNYGDVAAEISGGSMDDVTAYMLAGGIGTLGVLAEDCKNYGDVNAGAYCDFAKMDDDYYSLTAFAGGIMAVGDSAKDCVNYGDVTKYTEGNISFNAAAGIIGMMGSEGSELGKIERCVNHGMVKELGGGTSAANKTSGCGGIAGIARNSYGVSISECLNTGDVAAKGRKSYAGGIFARWANAVAEIRNCYNTGDISASGEESAAGGVAGRGELYYCYNTGAVTGQKYLSSVGAIAGAESKAVACGYVEGTAETGLGTGFDNTACFSAAEFADCDLFDAFDSSIWTKSGANETYSYPQLVNTLNEKQYVSGIEITVPDNQVKVGMEANAAYVISPADAEEKTLVWTSGNEKVATVDQNGLITGVAAGNAVITAASVDGGGAAASIALRVVTEGEEVPETAIGVTIGSAVAIPGGKAKVLVTIDEASGANVIEFTLAYDTTRLVLDSAAAGALLRDLGCDINAAETGKVRFAFDSTDSLVHGGTLLELTFTVKETAALGDAYVRFGTEDEAMLLQRAESADSLNYVDIEHAETEGCVSVVDILYGDVNFDGRVNTTDANIIRRYCVKLIDLSAEALVAGDVNLDGKVNVIDANIIRSYAVRLLDSLPYTGR
ncbi:MAG: Ig-like domain-containing protein, partial [Clostridia bacterium]|nr:Ig-like domain-containing protein [Clostridia bacterium]